MFPCIKTEGHVGVCHSISYLNTLFKLNSFKEYIKYVLNKQCI